MSFVIKATKNRIVYGGGVAGKKEHSVEFHNKFNYRTRCMALSELCLKAGGVECDPEFLKKCQELDAQGIDSESEREQWLRDGMPGHIRYKCPECTSEYMVRDIHHLHKHCSDVHGISVADVDKHRSVKYLPLRRYFRTFEDLAAFGKKMTDAGLVAGVTEEAREKIMKDLNLNQKS